MSSPKRAAKRVAKSASKTATKSAAKRTAKPNAAAMTAAGASADAQHLAEAIEQGIADGRLDVLSADALQALLAAACRVYTARSEAGEQLTPVKPYSISATDAMVTASGLLRAADLSTFELGMWQSWTGR